MRDQTRRVFVATAVVFAVALSAHAILGRQYRSDPFFKHYVADALSYDQWAARLARAGLTDEPVFDQAPLFPVLLSGLYARVAPEARPGAALWMQATLAALAIALLVPIGGVWFGDHRVGLAAAGLALLYSPLLFHALKLLPVALPLATQGAAIALLGVARSRRTLGWCAATGGAIGLAALARAEFLLFAPLAALALLTNWPAPCAPTSALRRLAPALALTMGCVACVLPATAHNLRQGDRVLIAAAAGQNLFIGNQRGAKGGYKELTARAGDLFTQRVEARVVAEEALGRSLRPSEVSSWWAGRAVEEIAADPAGWLVLEARKLARVLHPGEPTELYSLPLERSLYLPLLWLLPVGAWTLLGLGAAGLALAWRAGRREVWPLVALLGVHVLVLLLFLVQTRYRLPLMYAVAPFAGSAVVAGIEAWHAGRRRVVMVGFAAVLVGTAISAVATRATERDYRRLSSVLSIENRLDEALAVLGPELERPEPSPYVLDQAGWVSQKMGRFADAGDYYERALRDPSLAPARARQARTRLAVVLERLGDLAGAGAQHDLAVTSGYANAGTFYERGTFLLRRGRRSEAREDLRRAAALDPSWPAPRAALQSLAGRP